MGGGVPLKFLEDERGPIYLRARASKSFLVVLSSIFFVFSSPETNVESFYSKIVCRCVFIVFSSSKTSVDPFTFELDLRKRLQLFVVSSLSLVSRKPTWRYFTPNSSFEFVCSCVLIVCSYFKTNMGSFSSELELQNRLELFFCRL